MELNELAEYLSLMSKKFRLFAIPQSVWVLYFILFLCLYCKRSSRKVSLLEGLCLPLSKFLLALKLFELEVSARHAACEPGLAYNKKCIACLCCFGSESVG